MSKTYLYTQNSLIRHSWDFRKLSDNRVCRIKKSEEINEEQVQMMLLGVTVCTPRLPVFLLCSQESLIRIGPFSGIRTDDRIFRINESQAIFKKLNFNRNNILYMRADLCIN